MPSTELGGDRRQAVRQRNGSVGSVTPLAMNRLTGVGNEPAVAEYGDRVWVTNLRDLPSVPGDAPGPARRLTEHLASIVRAATSGPGEIPWVTAIPCRRRPQHRPCGDRITVRRPGPSEPIEWWCPSCGDQGVISGWQGSLLDLSHSTNLENADGSLEIEVSDETAAALRDLLLRDRDLERLVYGIWDTGEGLRLPGDEAELKDLLSFVSAETNHEASRTRRVRLDNAFVDISDALNEAMGS